MSTRRIFHSAKYRASQLCESATQALLYADANVWIDESDQIPVLGDPSFYIGGTDASVVRSSLVFVPFEGEAEDSSRGFSEYQNTEASLSEFPLADAANAAPTFLSSDDPWLVETLQV